jgi:NAD+ kinase
VNGKNIGKEIIGDGVIISTPFGSTGYYRSITDGIFEVGIGVAFNNSTEQVDHMVLREDSEVEIRIMRGPAVAYADNNEQEISLKAGDKIVIRKSDEVARIIKFK